MPSDPVSRRWFLRRSGCTLCTLSTFGFATAGTVLPVTEVAGSGVGRQRTYDIPAADGVNVDRDARMMLVRFANRVYAIAMSCPHENGAVRWLKKDRRFQCSKHESTFAPDGAYVSGKAPRSLDRFPITRDGTAVIVSLDRAFRSDQNAEAWEAATVTLDQHSPAG